MGTMSTRSRLRRRAPLPSTPVPATTRSPSPMQPARSMGLGRFSSAAAGGKRRFLDVNDTGTRTAQFYDVEHDVEPGQRHGLPALWRGNGDLVRGADRLPEYGERREHREPGRRRNRDQPRGCVAARGRPLRDEDLADQHTNLRRRRQRLQHAQTSRRLPSPRAGSPFLHVVHLRPPRFTPPPINLCRASWLCTREKATPTIP